MVAQPAFVCAYLMSHAVNLSCMQESHRQINPTGIVAIGPELDYFTPHGRETM